MTEAAACAWCSRTFTPRTTGGHAQRFCSAACRRALDVAGRAWVAEAIATGMLTPQALRNGAASTRALLAGVIPRAAISEARIPAPVAPAERADEVVALLDAVLVTLLEMPDNVMAEIPEPLCDKLDAYIAERLEEADGQP